MSETAPTPAKQERAVATREALLDAAIRRFASTGYEAASTRQIEQDAGVKRGLISYHFGSKEALWKAATQWLFDRASKELRMTEEAANNIDEVARLRYFVRAFVQFSAKYPEINRLMIREGMDDDWRLEWLVEHVVRPWYERIHILFERARRIGATPDIAYPHFYYLLTSSAAMMFSMAPEARRLAGIDTSDDAVISAHADAIADLLFPGDNT